MPVMRCLVLVLAMLALGCGDDDAANTPHDAGTHNDAATMTDAGTPDAATADGGTPDAGPRLPTESELLSEDAPLWHFDLELDPADLTWLNANARDEQYVPADLVFQGQRWSDVRVRYKGGFGSLLGCFDGDGNLTCPKLSIKVSINHTDKRRRFSGLRKLLFHGCQRDRTCLRERVSYGLFRDMGIATARTASVTVSINGGPRQLYVMVEELDDEFLQAQFDDANGNLYKERWPTNPSASYYVEGLQTNESIANVQRMVEFAQVLSTTTLADYDARVSPFVDLEAMGRYTAVDVITHNWDGIWKFYCATPELCGNHNYFIYDDPGSGKLVIVPWDLDHTFNRPFEDMGRSFNDDGPDVCELEPLDIPGIMIAGTRNPQCDPLMRGIYQGNGWARYRTALSQLLMGERTNRTAVLERLNRYRALVRPTVPNDPSAPSLEDWDAAVAVLRQVIHAQYNAAELLLMEP